MSKKIITIINSNRKKKIINKKEKNQNKFEKIFNYFYYLNFRKQNWKIELINLKMCAYISIKAY